MPTPCQQKQLTTGKNPFSPEVKHQETFIMVLNTEISDL